MTFRTVRAEQVKKDSPIEMYRNSEMKLLYPDAHTKFCEKLQP